MIFPVLKPSTNSNSSRPQEAQRAEGWCRCVFSSGAKHFFGHCLTLAFFALLLVVGAAWFLPNIKLSNNPAIQQKLKDYLDGSGIEVDFKEIQFVSGRGIRVSGVRAFLRDACEEGSQSDHVSRSGRFRPAVEKESKCEIGVSEVWFGGAWSPVSILDSDFLPSEVELVQAKIRLWQDENGKLKIPKINLPSKGGKLTLKNVRLINSTVTIYSAQRDRPVVLENINLQLHRIQEAVPQNPVSHNSEVSLSSSASTSTNQTKQAHRVPVFRPVLGSANNPGRYVPVSTRVKNEFQGRQNQSVGHNESKVGIASEGTAINRWAVHLSFRPSGFEPVIVSGSVSESKFDFELSSSQIHLHQKFWDIARPFLPEVVRDSGRLTGWLKVNKCLVTGSKVGSTVAVANAISIAGWQLTNVDIKGQLSEGMIRHKRLAEPVMDLGTEFEVDLNGVKLKELRGKVAGGTFYGSLQKFGWSSPLCQFSIKGKNLPFGPQWVPALIEKYRRKYPDFQPVGHFDCDLHYTLNDNSKLQTKGTIDVKDMSFLYAKFPVRIKGAYGRFFLNNSKCNYTVVTKDPQYPLQIDGWFHPRGDLWRGKMNIRSTSFHPFGKSILQAFSRFPKTVAVLKQLNASGFLATSGFIEKKEFDQPADIHFTTKIQRGEVKHDLFPYRISGIHGQVQFDNGDVTVNQLTGTGATGSISAKAKIKKNRSWSIEFDARAMELSQNLYQALKPEFKEMWKRLNPRGVLDQVKVTLAGGANQKPKTILVCNQFPAVANRRSFLTLKPVSFPYQLDSVSGNVRYEDGTVWLDTIRARHRQVKIGFDGKGKIESEGWNFLLTNLSTSQIPFDNDLKTALPSPIRSLAERIQFQGQVGISGSISLSMNRTEDGRQKGSRENASDNGPIRFARWKIQDNPVVPDLADVNWNVRLDLVNARLNSGVPFRNVHGVVRLIGARRDAKSFSYGSLDVDSATINGIQVREIKGPISMNGKEFSFGTAAHLLSKTQAATSVSATALGGRLSLDGRVLTKSEAPFVLQATANHIDLRKLAARFGSPSTDISGLGFGSIFLKGDGTGTDSLRGKGIVRIKNAKLYEIPVFLQLLKILRVRTPDRTAFDEGKIDFVVHRRELHLNRIELLGDAFSLLGKGTVGFDQSIDLDFYTVLGRNQMYFPVLTELVKAGSQQLLWISIEGTIGNPSTKREVLKALNEAVRNVITELQAVSQNNS